MKLIILAEQNLASKNICKVLLKNHPELEKNIFKIKENVLDIDKHISFLKKKNCELLIVASSHKSSAGVNTLTCHAPGNWTSNDLGGQKEELSIAPALYLREALLELKKQQERLKLDNYQVSLEVTHHSPTIDIPVIFVEVGSSEKQWKDMKACRAISETIYKLATKEPAKVPIYVGFGGNHYAPTFTRRVIESRIAFGHLCPKYQLDKVSEEIILQSLSKTNPSPQSAVIEWKGTNAEQREKLIKIFERNGIKWVKDKELKQ